MKVVAEVMDLEEEEDVAAEREEAAGDAGEADPLVDPVQRTFLKATQAA